MSQSELEEFTEKVPPKLPSIGDVVPIPTAPARYVEAKVVELRGPHVVVELPDKTRLVGKYGMAVLEGVEKSSWYFKVEA